jgi:hypothetical protein
MARKAIRSASDSQNPSVVIRPRSQRLFQLTPLGHQAVKWLKAQGPLDDEYAFVCPGCLRPLANCSCPIDER